MAVSNMSAISISLAKERERRWRERGMQEEIQEQAERASEVVGEKPGAWREKREP